jgi:hypothetical protein
MYYAGSDELRTSELLDALDEKGVEAIWAARGASPKPDLNLFSDFHHPQVATVRHAYFMMVKCNLRSSKVSKANPDG